MAWAPCLGVKKRKKRHNRTVFRKRRKLGDINATEGRVGGKKRREKTWSIETRKIISRKLGFVHRTSERQCVVKRVSNAVSRLPMGAKLRGCSKKNGKGKNLFWLRIKLHVYPAGVGGGGNTFGRGSELS